MAQHLSKSEFQQKVIEEKKPVLVDFFAGWCGPCQAMAPVVDEIADELKDKAGVYKVDIEKEADLANEYNVLSIPTLLVFKDGKVAKQFNGVTDKNDLIEALE
jgi:thioredoxin 1